MPELPDVAGFKKYIDATALHQAVEKTSVRDERILRDVTTRQLATRLKGAKLTTTHRHGKFLFVKSSNGGWLVLHFGMTGDVAYYERGGREPRFTRLLLDFENGAHLAYQSQRMLGQVNWTDDIEEFVKQHEMGPDALDDEVDLDRFKEMLDGRSGSLKSTLMNQSIVAGIGNVYADEILFQAGLHPETSVNKLNDKDIKTLHRVMKRVLRVAADHGADVDSLPDGYLLKERQTDGKAKCPKGHGKLKQATVSGRTSYYCATCQPK